ncbi:hypothetical protein [Paenibacillus oryzisoli]|uniref:hypothetical protein n=1 Tax=Paenibacillus oryzisoli TaxID=1850517 RepID=UPI001EFBD1A2|nr:hypothetical protein [Paenibacillus oryzisoli]
MKEEIVLFKIHNGLKDGKDHYEATRKHWKMSKRRIESIRYAVGINRGKVECAFQPSKWGIVEEGEDNSLKALRLPPNSSINSKFQKDNC